MKRSLSRLKRKFNKFHAIRNNEQYVIMSLDMVGIDERNIVVFKLKDLKNETYLLKTAREIVLDHSIALRLGKEDLLQVSHFAGYEFNSTN